MLKPKSLAIAACLTAPLIAAPGAHAAAAPDQCPAAFPVDQVKPGLKGYGLTVSKGTKPERFTYEVEDVLKDGIAPGVDLIIVKADSPAISKVKGVWAGMSGSPLYTPDGRILGALSYGFSAGPSKLAGITPAADMKDVLSLPAKLRLPKRVAARAPQENLSQLPMPLGVSGINRSRLKKFNAQLAKTDSTVRLYGASASSGKKTSRDEIVAGGNFAAALSYGDVTFGGVGTTTMVCGDKALAFGHPFTLRGKVTFSAHAASAITVVDDPTFAPYKIANIGGVVGTLTQDRTAAVNAMLGNGPRGVPITSTVTAEGRKRTGTSVAAMGADAGQIAGIHLLSNADRVFDGIAPGSATLTWKVSGTADGKPWTLQRSNRFASSPSEGDISALMPSELATILTSLHANRFSKVTFDGVTAEADISDEYGLYSVDKVAAKSGSGWKTLGSDGSLSAKAGSTIRLRVTLKGYRSPAKDVYLSVKVPKNRKGSAGALTVAGLLNQATAGADCLILNGPDCAADVKADSFPDLVRKLDRLPGNDHVQATLSFGKDGTRKAVKITDRTTADQVVNGSFTIAIRVK